MKKVLLNLAAAFVLVSIAGTCAFAQQSQSNEVGQSIRLEKQETPPAKIVTESPKADIYRANDASQPRLQPGEVNEKGNVVQARPIVKKASVASSTSTQATGTAVSRVELQKTAPSTQVSLPANTVKAAQGVAEAPKGTAVVKKARVNNTVNAVPANYKPIVQETK